MPSHSISSYPRQSGWFTFAAVGCFVVLTVMTANADPAPADDATAAYLQGNAYFKSGDNANALAAYDRALQLHPQFAKAYNNRGVVYLARQNDDQAIADFSHALQLDPTIAQAFYNRGRAYFFEGTFDQAVSDFGHAIQLKPDYADAYNNRGSAYVQLKDYAHALVDFRQAVQLNPEDKLARQNLADVQKKMGPEERPAAVIPEAPLPSTPTPPEPANRPSETDENKSAYEKAITECNQAISRDPQNAAAYNDRATNFAAMGDYDHALADYNSAIGLLKTTGRANPKWAQLYYNRGLCYEDQGDQARAISDYTRALQIDPHLLGAHNNLAWTLATCPQDDLRNGKKALAEATQACELSGWKDPASWDTLAAASAETGDFASAVKWQTKCLESPGLPASEKSGAQARLALYQAHRAYHEGQ